MSDIERLWLPLPHDYQDEVIPPPRLSPDDWIMHLDDGAAALAGGDDDPDDPGERLIEGAVVKFDWVEKYGTCELTFRRSEEGWDWVLAGDTPVASPGGDMFVAEQFNWESAMPTLDEFAQLCSDTVSDDGEIITVAFYAWSREPIAYAFRGGRFEIVR